MPRLYALGFLLSLPVLGLAQGAHADTMRCGQRLVTDGDSQHDVRIRCGEPVSALKRTEFRTARVWVNGRALERTVEVVVEEWVYDFGPRRFVQYLTFEQGRLVSVVSGQRGQK